jgi:hypothetical protein
MLNKLRFLAQFLFVVMITSCFSCKSKEAGTTDGQESKSSKKWDRDRAELEYELIQAETKLARTEKPYLVLNLKDREIVIKVKGAKVWSYPMEIDSSGAGHIDEFVRKFRGNVHRLIRPVTGKHLFAASDKTPDSVLAIVGEVVNVDPSLLQRDIPERFQISWSPSLILEVRTEVVGKPPSRFGNTFVQFKRALQLPFGESRIVMKMTSDQAVTLYRASQPGFPTMIYPPL